MMKNSIKKFISELDTITKIKLEKNEILVVRVKATMDQRARYDIKDYIKEKLTNVDVLVIDDSIELFAIKQPKKAK